MLVTGIDPGGRVTAYGVVRITESGTQVVSSGVIRVSTKLCFAERVRKIYLALSEVLNEHQPDVVSLENAFFGKNVRTAMMLGRVIGVVALATAEAASLGLSGPCHIPLTLNCHLRKSPGYAFAITLNGDQSKQLPSIQVRPFS